MRLKNLIVSSFAFALILGVSGVTADGQQVNPFGEGEAAAEPPLRTARDVFEESEAFVSAGKYDKAIPLLSQILNASPNHVPSAILQGKAYNGLGESQLALESFAHAVNYGAQFSPKVYGEALTERGKMFLQIGKFEEAADDFAMAIPSAPSDPERLFLRGKAYARMAKSPKHGSAFTKPAIDSLTRAISVKDDYAEAYVERGRVYSLLNQYDEAIADYKRAAAIDGKTTVSGRVYADLLSDVSGPGKPAPSTVEQLQRKRAFLAAALKAAKVGEDSIEIAQVEKRVVDVDSKIAELTPEVRVYPLQHASAADAVVVLEALLEGDDVARVGIDDRTNRVILSATRASHDVMIGILKQIDIPAEQPKKEKQTFKRVYKFESSAAAKDFSNFLRQSRKGIASVSTTGGKGGTQFMITAESQAALDDLEDVVSQVTEANKPESHSIRVVWLTDDAEEKAVPGDLQPVVAELRKMGIDGMFVKSQLVVRSMGRFKSSAKQGDYELSSNGDFENGVLDIELHVQKTTFIEAAGSTRRESVVDLTTQIEAPLGHPVVLGVSPSATGNSAFVVIVEP